MANMGFGDLIFGGFCIAVAYLPSDGFLSCPTRPHILPHRSPGVIRI